jgi:hypothetical protein
MPGSRLVPLLLLGGPPELLPAEAKVDTYLQQQTQKLLHQQSHQLTYDSHCIDDTNMCFQFRAELITY